MPIPTTIAEPEVETEIEVSQPTFHKVIVHNDDRTTVDFVIMLLQTVFHLTQEKAIELTLTIHHEGYGVAGRFTKEVAEEKSHECNQLADAYGFPLKTTSEEE